MKPVINEEKCDNCGACVDECLVGVIEFIGDEGDELVAIADPDRCMECGNCIVACSEGAITME